MRRALVLGSALALLVAAVATGGCATTVEEPVAPPPVAAPPQDADLGWEEAMPASGERLVFRASSFSVTEAGWRARIAIENRTGIPWRLPVEDLAVARTFGVMLLPDGDLEELERRNREGGLPAVRAARSFEPALPATLGPGESWSGAMSAPGALAAGRYVRLVYGALRAQEAPPEGLPTDLVWITDHAHRLRGTAGG